MSDHPELRSSPPSLSGEASPETSSQAALEQTAPIVVDLISSDSSHPHEDVPLPDPNVQPAEFAQLVDDVLSSHIEPPPFESNQQAQLRQEGVAEAEGSLGESGEDVEGGYESPESGTLKRKRALDKGKQRAEEDVAAVSTDIVTSAISSDPDPSTKVPAASRLQVFGITSGDAIKAALQVWAGLKQPAMPSKNSTIQFNNIRSLTDADLAYPGQATIVKKYGHCKYWMTREKDGPRVVETPKLIEGGTNNDAPRVTFSFPGMKTGTKYYIYHVVALDAALSGRNPHLSKSKLEAVSKLKNEADALTVVHLCGHKWCLNSDHYRIRTKRYNDQQVFCHFGLQSAVDQREFKVMRDFYCKHLPNKCWTVNYSGDFASGHVWEEGAIKKDKDVEESADEESEQEIPSQ